MVELTITVYSHHFEVTRISPRGRRVVEDFARRYIEYTLRKRRGRPGFDEVPDCVFAASNADRTQYRFHAAQMEEFKNHLRVFDLVHPDAIEWIEVPLYEPLGVDLLIQEGWLPKEKYKQADAIAFMERTEPPRKLLGMHTGYGKSFCTMQAVANISTLSVWSVQAKFLEKTRLDMLRTLQVELEDIIVVRDTKDLKLLLLKTMQGPIDCKIVLISSKLIQIWISLYEKVGKAIEGVGYSCMPQEFYPLLRAGVRVIDEVHMEFHFNFKQDLYTHVPQSISLSATMISDSRFRNQMYMLTYPLSCRFEVPYIPFISATAISYQFETPDRIRVLGRQGMYSHYVFEDSVMKNKKVLANYVKMIKFITEIEFVRDHREGESMVVYAASVEFCTYLVEEFRKTWSDLRIERYCGSINDPYENLINAQLVVTTLGSAGTNVDIPKLKCVLLTTSVDSTQGNIQGAGRLRDDKLEAGRAARFVWLYCEQVGRHVAYHNKKMGLLRPRALKLNEQSYSELL